MGFLEGTDSKDLPAKVSVDLPFWVAAPLALMPDRDFVALSIPPPYTSRVRNALAAEAKSVNLRTLAAGSGGGWYEAGKALDTVIDDATLLPLLHQTFKLRLSELMDLASRSSPNVGNAASTPSIEQDQFIQGLDEWEKTLLSVGEEASKKMKLWEAGKSTESR